MNPEIYMAAPIATILAATVAALISLVGLVISKENKVSEFRQEWINSLRQELSNYLANVRLHTQTFLFAEEHLGLEEKKEEIFKTLLPYRNVINEKYSFIRLRLNPEEKLHKELLSSLDTLRDLVRRKKGETPYTQADVSSAIDTVLQIAQRLLKAEWERVKKGERWFFVTKYFVVGLTVITLLTAVGVTYFQLTSTQLKVPGENSAATPPPNPAVQKTLHNKATQRP